MMMESQRNIQRIRKVRELTYLKDCAGIQSSVDAFKVNKTEIGA